MAAGTLAISFMLIGAMWFGYEIKSNSESSVPGIDSKYGVIGQGKQQKTLTPPGVCALYFYPIGGEEKTFVFSTEGGIWVQDYNGTLSCWPTLPGLDDVGTNHPFATMDEVLKTRIVFSEKIIPVDPNSLLRR